MRILPVIDLLGGQVVRGIAGRRDTYRPIASSLARDASPRSIASALVNAFGFTEAYVADLDAIAGGEPAWADYESIADCGLRLWLDAGVGDARRARALLDSPLHRGSPHRLIVGLESLTTTAALSEIGAVVDTDRLVFSLDLKQGQLLTTIAAWQDAPPLDVAAAAYAAGIRALIVLDLARVGLGQGTGTRPLCQAIRRAWPDVELIGGGGVRSAADLAALAADGLDAALVASALHDGRLTRVDLEH